MSAQWSPTAFCAYRYPLQDSLQIAARSGDVGLVFGLRGITAPGQYVFGAQDTIVVSGTAEGPGGWKALPGGLFELSTFLNRSDSVAFDGRFKMVHVDTDFTNFVVHTIVDTGSFKVRSVCQ